MEFDTHFGADGLFLGRRIGLTLVGLALGTHWPRRSGWSLGTSEHLLEFSVFSESFNYSVSGTRLRDTAISTDQREKK